MTCLVAAEAKTFLNANFPFLWGELPNANDINVHCIWVLGFPYGGGGEVRAHRRGWGFVVLGTMGDNLVRLVPLSLEPFCFGIPIFNGSGYEIHGVDVTHEGRVESFREEMDEDGLVCYPTEVGGNFELIDISKHIVLMLDKGLQSG